MHCASSKCECPLCIPGCRLRSYFSGNEDWFQEVSFVFSYFSGSTLTSPRYVAYRWKAFATAINAKYPHLELIATTFPETALDPPYKKRKSADEFTSLIPTNVWQSTFTDMMRLRGSLTMHSCLTHLLATGPNSSWENTQVGGRHCLCRLHVSERAPH